MHDIAPEYTGSVLMSYVDTLIWLESARIGSPSATVRSEPENPDERRQLPLESWFKKDALLRNFCRLEPNLTSTDQVVQAKTNWSFHRVNRPQETFDQPDVMRRDFLFPNRTARI